MIASSSAIRQRGEGNDRHAFKFQSSPFASCWRSRPGLVLGAESAAEFFDGLEQTPVFLFGLVGTLALLLNLFFRLFSAFNGGRQPEPGLWVEQAEFLTTGLQMETKALTGQASVHPPNGSINTIPQAEALQLRIEIFAKGIERKYSRTRNVFW